MFYGINKEKMSGRKVHVQSDWNVEAEKQHIRVGTDPVNDRQKLKFKLPAAIKYFF